jgi:hypothetical protein
MAIVVKDSLNRSPFWYACFATADGRRPKKSIKENSHSKANSLPKCYSAPRTVRSFCKTKAEVASDKTALRHEQVRNEFVAFLGNRSSLNIATVTDKDIAGFRDQPLPSNCQISVSFFFVFIWTLIVHHRDAKTVWALP